MLDDLKDHFHPHEGNDHHPHAYRRASAIALVLVVALVLLVSASQTGYIHRSDSFLSAVLPSVLVDLANEDRAENGIASVEFNETLAQAAQLKADHMAENGYFAHTSPSGVTPWEWFAQADYQYIHAGENLAVNFSDSEDVEEAWMDSPSHRENILAGKFTEVGIATARGEYEGKETVFVVQMFGHPSAQELADREESDSLAVAEENDTDTEQTEEETTDQQEESTSTTELLAQLQQDAEEIEGNLNTTEEADTETDTTEQEDTQAESQPETQPSQQEESESQETGGNELAQETSEEVASENEDADQPATTTTTTAPTADDGFATPTTVAQVQGESGVALAPERYASQFEHLLSSPEFVFRTLILTLMTLIVLALLISVGVEAKKHHLKQAGYSLTALALLVGVLYFGSSLLFPDPTIATQSDSRLSADISVSAEMP